MAIKCFTRTDGLWHFSDWVAFGLMHDPAPHLPVAPIDRTMNTEDEQALLHTLTECIATFPTYEN
jgi:hypothetical protein